MTDDAVYAHRGERVFKTGTTLADLRKGGFPYAGEDAIAVVGPNGERVPLRRCRGCGRPHPVDNGHSESTCIAVHEAPPYSPNAPRLLRPRHAGQAEMLTLWPAWAPRTPKK